MKKLLYFLFALLTLSLLSQAQSGTMEYKDLIRKADSLTSIKNYKAAADYFQAAFVKNGWKLDERQHYNAACVYARVGKKDAALMHLQRASISYYDVEHLRSDEDLSPLRND